MHCGNDEERRLRRLARGNEAQIPIRNRGPVFGESFVSQAFFPKLAKTLAEVVLLVGAVGCKRDSEDPQI